MPHPRNDFGEHHTAGERFRAVASAVALSVVSAGIGALATVAVIDGRDPGWDWTVIAAASNDLCVAAAVLVGAVGGVYTYRQRAAADQRAEWWKRAEKCGDYLVAGDAASDDDRYVLGVGMLRALSLDDARTGDRETRYILALSDIAALDAGVHDGDNEEQA